MAGFSQSSLMAAMRGAPAQQAPQSANPYSGAYARAQIFGGSPIVGNKVPGLPYSPTGFVFGTAQGEPASEKNITVGLRDTSGKQQQYNMPSLVPANTLGPTYDRTALMNLLGGKGPSRGQVMNAVGYANANGLLAAGKGFPTVKKAVAAELARHQLINQTYQQLPPGQGG